METFTDAAIRSVFSGRVSFCKFLSANDTGENANTHQSGYYIPKNAWSLLFDSPGVKGSNLERSVEIHWQDSFTTPARFEYYGTKTRNEYRMTRFGRSFPFRSSEYTGALLVLVRTQDEGYEGYVFNTEEDINAFLDTVGISAAQTNRLIDIRKISEEADRRVLDFLDSTGGEFPPSDEMSAAARNIADRGNTSAARTDPDGRLLVWTDMEFRLFHGIEERKYAPYLTGGFDSLEDMINVAKSILNRRKSRAGKSLEHHLSAVFDANSIIYDAQAVTEENKKPDFIFPSIAAYHNAAFPAEELVTLAAKTTCKDRWRQILNEADRLRDGNKYLCTLQQGISSAQMNEMKKEHVILVVPKEYQRSYAGYEERRASGQMMSVLEFVQFIQRLEAKSSHSGIVV